mmetsp:Transcript_21240/g.55431  ORF Transcript_21240/g.55431 Transcript_21240/m.55431 type:complete len:671 (-) Transcript_21240:107-2119(-)
MPEKFSIFVPGRVCLFGEHSDWAGGFRRFSPEIEKGYTIVVGTNQGLHAEIKKHPHSLVVTSCLADGTTHGPVTIPMRKKDLLIAARKGDFFSYVAGVAYKMLTDYQLSGIVINNFKTTLPAEKGLSSSAAVCVLTARAFSLLYDLKLTIRGEMEYAYQGEILTPSQCGRMDQGCAYGPRPVLMTYDGEHLDVEEMAVPPGTALHYVLVDLQGDKSTTIILQGLQSGYPEAKTEVDKGVHALLGSINKDINMRACELFSKGDAEGLGKLMWEAQETFDKYAQPACPSQLTMPLLHKVMTHEPLQPLVWGIKGVGSQGDGTGQLLCRSAKAQDEVQKILERDFKMPSITLTLASGTGIRVAVIPAAGFGAHNFPATLPVRAEMFPIIDDNGVAKPIILHNVEQLVQAGIERVLIVVQANDLHSFERLFKKPVPAADLARLPKDQQDYATHILKIGERVTFIMQDAQEGFGHAVHCCKEQVGNEPFMLMLGDHVYESTMDDRLSCVAQMIETYKKYQRNVLGLKTTPIEQVNRFGAIAGVLHRDDPADDGAGGFSGAGKLVDIHAVVEKPTVAYAREMLGIPNMPKEEVLTMFGLYILNPTIFTNLEERINKNVRDEGVFAFTPALEKLRKDEGVLGFVVEGQRHDIGDPASYLATLKASVGLDLAARKDGK